MGGWCGSSHPNNEKTGAQPERTGSLDLPPPTPEPGDSRKEEVRGVDKSLLMGGPCSGGAAVETGQLSLTPTESGELSLLPEEPDESPGV